MKLLFLGLSAFFFTHGLRDYLQMKGVENWFTEFGHFWDSPADEKYSIAVSIFFGFLFLYLAIKRRILRT